MSDLTIFMIGVCTSVLCFLFLLATVFEFKRLGRESETVKVRPRERD
jgi:hypothetical protein